MKVVMQGYPGCFHQEAANLYFRGAEIDFVPAITFDELARFLQKDTTIDYGIMAIENNIAGSILQNYRILREFNFRIIGEIYLPIHHNIMCLPGQTIEQIFEVHSHPMALNQCLKYLQNYKHIKLVEKEDTALSAKMIFDDQILGVASIGSKSSSELYKLDILDHCIETCTNNYTRFFILQRAGLIIPDGDFNKSSIYIQVDNERGSLLKVLEVVYNHNINLSKLQSFPVAGEIKQYFFYLDLDFENLENYNNLIDVLKDHTSKLEVLGVYYDGWSK